MKVANLTPFRIPALLALLSLSGFSHAEDRGPERWEPDMLRLEKRDSRQPPPENCLLFVGSSSIRMWKLEESWADAGALNNGFGGSTLADSIHHFDRVIAPYELRAVVIYAGDNDVSRGMTAEEVLADYVTLTEKIHDRFPGVPVVFIAIKPSQKRWDLWPVMDEANRLVSAHCEGHEALHYADIAAPMLKDADGPPATKWFLKDGLHLSEWGYAQWDEVVRAVLRDAGVSGL